jgi:hypothetical protein
VEANAHLLDLALSLKIKLADPDPTKDVEISLHQWANVYQDEDSDCRDRPRDLAHLAKDKRFQKPLRDAVQAVAGDPNFEAQAAGKAGLTELRREWMMSHLGQIEESGLPKTDQTLDVIQNSMPSEMFAEFPDAFAALKKINLVPVATRTLQSGIIDEYGWPAFEQLYKKVATQDSKPQVFGHFPYAIISDGLTAHVLRGNEVITKVELNLPQGHNLKFLMYLDGDLAVWASKSYEVTAWWHSQQKKKDKGWFHEDAGMDGMSVDLPGGGSFTGGRTIHVGHQPLRGIIAHAGRRVRLLAKLINQKDPANAGATQQTKAADQHAEKAMQPFEGYFSLQPEHSFFASLSEAGAWFAGETDEPEVFPGYLDGIEALLKGVPSSLWRAITSSQQSHDRLQPAVPLGLRTLQNKSPKLSELGE